jgi:putative endonuclease
VKTFYVYLLSNSHRTLYLGVTSNLTRRLAEHRSLQWGGFTSRYKITKLVYFETTPNGRAAIAREKQIKAWKRSKKITLIQSVNPNWTDLAEEWFLERRDLDSSLRSE